MNKQLGWGPSILLALAAWGAIDIIISFADAVRGY